MKPYLFGLVMLGFLASSAVPVRAGVSVNQPSSFALKVGESVMVSNHQDMKIELVSVEGKQATNNPNSLLVANITASTPGGCGPNADPRCLGGPSFSMDYGIYQGATVTALGLAIRPVAITSAEVRFEIKLVDGGNGDQPPPIRVVDVAPREIKVCSNGNAEDCSVCDWNDCAPRSMSVATSDTAAIQLPALNLPAGEVLKSAVHSGPDDRSAFIITTQKEAKLLHLFPVQAEITYYLDALTGASAVLRKPWWSFLAKY